MNGVNINKINNKLLLVLCLITALLLVNTTEVYADSAPTPTVEIKINNLDKEYYVALFTNSENKSYQYLEVFNKKELDSIFLYYENEYYYGYQNQILDSENNTLIFRYNSKVDKFKIVLYDPISKDYIESPSQVFNSNASYSYDIKTNAIEEDLSEYNLSQAIFKALKVISLFVFSLIITIGFELLIAYIFKIRNGKSIGIICITNFITQLGLHIFSNTVSELYLKYYILIEIIICAIEATAYYFLLKISKPKRILYAVVANTVSATIGSLILANISNILLGIFRIIFYILDFLY